MMEASGIQPVLPQQQIHDQTNTLRVNQRITAEILEVAMDHVVLALDGFPVLARLTSSDQLAELANQKTAQFIVRDSSSKQLLLQLVSTDTSQSGAETSESALIAKLLSHFGIPLDEGNLALAQQMIDEGVPITPETLAGLRMVLDSIGSWSQQQAGTAVRLLKAGIPLSESALSLALGDHPGVLDPLQKLYEALQSLQTQKVPAGLQSSIKRSLEFLDRLFPGSCSRAEIVSASKLISSALGSTLENSLLHALSDPARFKTDPLLQLLTLRAQLQNVKQSSLVKIIDQVFSELQFQGMSNLTSPEHTNPDGSWFTLDLPFYAESSTEKQGIRQARIRIAYENEQDRPVVDPSNTHIKLHFPLSGKQEIDIDLVLADNSAAARISASNQQLQVHAQKELPALEEGLEALGYRIQGLECTVKVPREMEDSTPHLAEESLSAINVEA